MSNDPAVPSTILSTPETAADEGLKKQFHGLITLVRAKMRDFPELNRLIEGRETSNQEIAFAIMETIDDFNTTPPLIETCGLTNFPSISLLIKGSVIRVLESVGLLQTRNHMVYSDGQGVQVSVSDKSPQLMSWIQIFSNTYEKQKRDLKIALNLQGALGGRGVPSEYAVINGLFDDLDIL